MGHDIAVESVAVGLGTTLRVEILRETAELAEDVEAVEEDEELTLEEGT